MLMEVTSPIAVVCEEVVEVTRADQEAKVAVVSPKKAGVAVSFLVVGEATSQQEVVANHRPHRRSSL